VVLGKAAGFDATLDVSSLNGSNGFRLDGAADFDKSGRSVSSAGDMNGDGFGDVIVGTGDNFYEFFYVKQMPAGDFYYGGMGTEPTRTSIHASGVVNVHMAKQIVRYPAKQKLHELKGLRQLCAMSIGKLVFQNPQFSKPPRKAKVNGLIYFDIRKFKSDVGLMIFLLEPENYSSLSSLNKFMDNPHFTIITETNPWLVVAVHEGHPGLKQRNRITERTSVRRNES